MARFLIATSLAGIVLGNKIAMHPAIAAMIFTFVVVVGSRPCFFKCLQVIGDCGEHLFDAFGLGQKSRVGCRDGGEVLFMLLRGSKEVVGGFIYFYTLCG